MLCTCAKFDSDDGIFYCDITGDSCMFTIPSSKACSEQFGEGPEKEDNNG